MFGNIYKKLNRTLFLTFISLIIYSYVLSAIYFISNLIRYYPIIYKSGDWDEFKGEMTDGELLGHYLSILIILVFIFFIVNVVGRHIINLLVREEIKVTIRLKDGTTFNNYYFYRITYGDNLLIGLEPHINSNDKVTVPKENISFIQYETKIMRAWDENNYELESFVNKVSE
ncbi:hypothetical protein [Litchfieldia alkalitelluris]|uniref:hypothetical protein n=1 Tax=Litchfieldia alkalitelluris TaxID=304268 RepID=UPI001956D913|nr:hypothetical protein [Litchfieldia alkalitelluris]